mgnify:CR=1 FL=1
MRRSDWLKEIGLSKQVPGMIMIESPVFKFSYFAENVSA